MPKAWELRVETEFFGKARGACLSQRANGFQSQFLHGLVCVQGLCA